MVMLDCCMFGMMFDEVCAKAGGGLHQLIPVRLPSNSQRSRATRRMRTNTPFEEGYLLVRYAKANCAMFDVKPSPLK